MSPVVDPEDRVQQLLADRAIFGLSVEEERELQRLLGGMPQTVDLDAMDRTAAQLALAWLPPGQEQLPKAVAATIRSAANVWISHHSHE